MTARRGGPPLVLLVLAATALPACGGGGDGGGGGSRQDYVDALVEASSDAENGILSAAEEACFAEAIVDAVGVERLADAVSPDEIREEGTTSLADLGVEVDADDGEAYYERASQCTDLRAVFIESEVGTGEISDVAARCLDERLTDDLVRDFMVAGFSQTRDELAADTEVVDELRAVFAECSQQ